MAEPKRAAGPFDFIKAIASLRLTVTLFVLAFVLVFLGTLAQMDAGNWTVVKQYFRSALVWIPFQTLVRFGQVFLYFPKSFSVPGSFPFPGGWLIGGLLLANLLAAHAKWIWIIVRNSNLSYALKNLFHANQASALPVKGETQLSAILLGILSQLSKRSGILILHAGVVVMMLGELFTGLFAIEGNMTIVANGSSNFVEVHNAAELALVSPADAQNENVVVVPASLLRKAGKGGKISHDDLPVDIEVVEYMLNSKLSKGPPSHDSNPATAGFGLETEAIEQQEGAGVDTEQKIDAPSAYVKLLPKNGGTPLGTYLVSLWLKDQPIEIDGKTYTLSLRPKRVYKPYTLHLKEFHHDVYLGTDKPKNFSSVIQVVDPSRGENREVNISMNAPLWYGGETFYQQGFLEGDRGTILQVVRNPSWLLPYVSCAMVAIGMLVHFSINLIGFLMRRLAS
ncbi:MAG TPA: cytochrome c biogenesis protein ResB [Gemmataceae bacterium]|jgi:hypothetical protein